MKRNFFRLLVSAVLMTCCTVMAWAGLGTPPDDEIWYTTINDEILQANYDEVLGCKVISNTYENGKGVMRLDGPVTKVGDYAFTGYYTFNDTGLKSISLPNSVKSIGYQAFYWLDYLTEISLGNSVETISDQAFCDCDALETIVIPASVTSLGEKAFYDCNNLKFVAIGRGVTDIGTYTFYDCNELKSVVIDGNVVTLGYGAFYHCDKLESVSFLGDTSPSSYGDYCFSKCSANLKYYVLKEYYDRYNSVSVLSGNVVAGPPDNEIWYSTNDGCTAESSDKGYEPQLNAYMGNHGVQFFESNPPYLDSFYNCFENCNNLVSVVLPSSITYIGQYAFQNCSNLVSVSIPNSVTSIGRNAFRNCRLQTITIPNSVKDIGTVAFYGCTSLRSVTILGTINNIGDLAFSRCYNLYDIFYFGTGSPEAWSSFGISCPATIYVKDATGRSNWDTRPVRSWRSGKGDGSRENPLEIENYINLYGFALEVSIMGSKDLCGKLTADIVGNSNVLKADGSLNGTPSKEWVPIGSSDKVFCGEFNGNGHTISGLYHNSYDSGSSVGLFGRTGEGAYIHDLGLVDSYMSGGGLNGGICGDMAYGRIDNCYNAATVAWGGGIAGWCRENASITNCYNVGHINTNGSGITDLLATNGRVENCYSLEGVSRSAINNIYGTTNNVEVKNANAFTGGEVCWLLNGSKIDTKWRQQIGTDSYPVFSGNYLVGNDNVKYYNEGMCNQSSDYRHHSEIAANGIIPTATSTGKYGYYKCTYCNKEFKDEHGCIPATEENLTVPVATNKEIWYTTSNNQKLTPNKTDVFGVTYNDANNVYEYGLGVIRFEDNVTSIGNEAFHTLGSLTSITIPESVTSIGNKAFMFCTNLTSITIPSSVTSIGEEAIDACYSITSIDIPSSVTSIGNFAIYNCQALSSVTFHSLPTVGQYAVSYCTNLSAKTIDLTDSDKPYIGTSLDNYPGFTKARYHRTLEKDKWGTIVLPFAPTDGMDGLEFYELKEMATNNDGSLVFTKVDAPTAGVPYLFRNTSSTSDFTLTNNEKPDVTVGITNQTVGDFTLKGSFQQTSLNTTDAPNGNLYYLKDNEFFHANGKINIAPFRAYIESDGSSQVKSFMLVIEDDDVTAIPGIMDEDGTLDETEAIYDLSGRRLAAPVKGQINIIRTKSGKTIKRLF